MDRSQLVLGTHVMVAVGMLGIGVVRVRAGNPVGGLVNAVFAVAIVGVGLFVARRQ